MINKYYDFQIWTKKIMNPKSITFTEDIIGTSNGTIRLKNVYLNNNLLTPTLWLDNDCENVVNDFETNFTACYEKEHTFLIGCNDVSF